MQHTALVFVSCLVSEAALLSVQNPKINTKTMYAKDRMPHAYEPVLGVSDLWPRCFSFVELLWIWALLKETAECSKSRRVRCHRSNLF